MKSAEQWFMRALRFRLRLTQEDIARDSGLSQSRVSVLERSAEQPPRDELMRLMDVFIARAAGRAVEQLVLQNLPKVNDA